MKQLQMIKIWNLFQPNNVQHLVYTNSILHFKSQKEYELYVSTGMLAYANKIEEKNQQARFTDNKVVISDDIPAIVFMTTKNVDIQYGEEVTGPYNYGHYYFTKDNPVVTPFRANYNVPSLPIVSRRTTTKLFDEIEAYIAEKMTSVKDRLVYHTDKPVTRKLEVKREKVSPVSFIHCQWNYAVTRNLQPDFTIKINIHHTPGRTIVELNEVFLPPEFQHQGILSGLVGILSRFMQQNKLGDEIYGVDASDFGYTTIACKKYNLVFNPFMDMMYDLQSW